MKRFFIYSIIVSALLCVSGVSSEYLPENPSFRSVQEYGYWKTGFEITYCGATDTDFFKDVKVPVFMVSRWIPERSDVRRLDGAAVTRKLIGRSYHLLRRDASVPGTDDFDNAFSHFETLPAVFLNTVSATSFLRGSNQFFRASSVPDHFIPMAAYNGPTICRDLQRYFHKNPDKTVTEYSSEK